MVDLGKNESETLLTMEELGGKASVKQIADKSSLPHASIMRAALTLEERELVRITENKQTIIKLNEEGRSYATNGLPERRLINALIEQGGKASIERIAESAKIQGQFVPIALGWIRRKEWAVLHTETNTLQLLKKPKGKQTDEKLLKLLNEKEHVITEDLDPKLQSAVQILKRRKLLEIKYRTGRIISITKAGWTAIKKGIKTTSEVTQLTPELITSRKWRKAKLQKYNINAPVAKTWPGKKHPYLQFLDEVREKLITLGFKEMTGPTVETSFFNFDALFTPQDHPAREIFGIYLVKSPEYGSLDDYENIVDKVRRTHENGWKTGSAGWGYKYSTKEAGRLVLRGHGTCQSVRMLLSKELEIPSKYFSIVRCYRPEVVDKTHLTEFNQVEGIVVSEDLTLRDLLGVLEKFAIEIAGADAVKFRPDYFPFTEPSVEVSAYKKDYGWIEFGGSGIFRPEVTMPLDIEVPVIAWGIGIDRLFMLKAEIDDIRHVFAQDLDWIRRKGVI